MSPENLAHKVLLPLVIPTSTMLVIRESKVLTFSAAQHEGLLVAPGGKREPVPILLDGKFTGWRYECPKITAMRELKEEVGLDDPQATYELFGIATDLTRDLRIRTLGRMLDHKCDASVENISGEGHFGVPDNIYLVTSSGEPKVDKREGIVIKWVDLNDPMDLNRFGAGHGPIFLALKRWWDTGAWANGRKPSPEEMDDFALLLQNCQ